MFKKDVEKYLFGTKKLINIYKKHKNNFKSYAQFRLAVNKIVEKKLIKEEVQNDSWIFKNEGIWKESTYEELSSSEKSIYNVSR